MKKNSTPFHQQEFAKDSFLLFVDILGFSETVKHDLDGSFKLLKKIKEDVLRLSKTKSWLKDLKGTVFSDSIIVGEALIKAYNREQKIGNSPSNRFRDH